MIIKPISELRNNFNEISQLCHQQKESIYMTKNGKGDLVVLSMAKYEEIEAKLDLYQILGVAEEQRRNTDKRYTHEEVMAHMRKKYESLSGKKYESLSEKK